MALDSTDSLERMTPAEIIGLARELIGELTRLRAKYEKVSGALAKLRVEHQAVKDELARLKNLPPRPPQKPSGMDKATDRPDSQAKAKGGRSTQRRGSNLDKLTVTQTIEVKVDAPAGSRHKGYEEIVVQDLVLNPLVTRYRRERWETPDGKDPDRAARSRHRRRLWPAPASRGSDAALSVSCDDRENSGAAQRRGRGDLETPSGPPAGAPSSRRSAPRTPRF